MKINFIKTFVVALFLIINQCNLSFSSNISKYIENLQPYLNSSNQEHNSNIEIFFTQDMSPATIVKENIIVFGSQTGLLNIVTSYDSKTKKGIINPTTDLKFGEQVIVVLTNRVATSMGVQIEPFVYKFRVKPMGGNGIFHKTFGISNFESADLKSGDLNKDGKVDLLINNKVYLNNGLGVFIFLNALSTFGKPEIADFNNDGNLDILIENTGILYFYNNDGLGNFTQTYSVPGKIGECVDLDGDGFLDLTYFSTPPNVNFLKNLKGILTPSSEYPFSFPCGDGNYEDAVSGEDMNNDGKMDVIAVHGSERSAGSFIDICRGFDVLYNTKTSFTPDRIYSDLIQSTSPIIRLWKESRLFDCNGDSYVDILSPNVKLINNSGTEFSNYISFSNSNCIVLDLNGDGSLDMASSLAYSLGSPLFSDINNGKGEFNRIDGYNGKVSNTTSGDFDNDGDIDIAAFNYENNEIEILMNEDKPSPVELLTFVSELNENQVTLHWSTNNEVNNMGFEIERANQIDLDYKKIGFVKGQGNNNEKYNYKYGDNYLNTGIYKYRLKQMDYNGDYSYFYLSTDVNIGIPNSNELLQNYPNPFNPTTTISYNLKKSANVKLSIFDNVGREILLLINKYEEAGYHTINFNATSYSTGVYYYKLEADGYTQTNKMFLLK